MFVCLSVCPTNQKAAFPNMPGKDDFPSESEWSQVIAPGEPESELSSARNPIGQPETNENLVF